MNRGTLRLLEGAIVACGLAMALAGPAAAAQPPSIALSRSEVTLGSAVTVTGAAPAGANLALEADAWPFHGFAPLAQVRAGSAGAYAFPALRPDRDMLLRVAVTGASPAPASVTATLTVLPRVRLVARVLGAGRTLLALGVRHARTADTTPTLVRWFAARPGTHAYHLIAVSSASELPGGLLRAQVVVDPPSRRFTFRVCLNPPWEAAMGTAAERGPCPRAGFVLPGAP